MSNRFLTYNGKEFEERLGLNIHEMEMHHYDQAIARWIVQDPVTYHSMSPYNAFDNNPVFRADPSGADARFYDYNQNHDGDDIAWVINYSDEGAAKLEQFNNEAETRSREETGTDDSYKDDPGKDYQKLFAAKAEEAGKYLAYLENSKDSQNSILFDTKEFVSNTGRTFGLVEMGGLDKTDGNVEGLNQLLTYTSPITITLGEAIKAGTNMHGEALSASQISSAKLLGRSFGVASLMINAYQYKEALKNNNQLGQDKAMLEAIANGLIMRGGVIGWGIGGGIHLSLILNPSMKPVVAKRDWTKTCFVAGTKIILKDRTTKNIEDIVVGDEILSVNMNTMEIEPDQVLIVPEKEEKYNKIYMKYDNGVENIASAHHPFFVKGKGWAVYDVEMAKKDLSFEVNQLTLGDIVYYYDHGVLKETKIIELVDQKEEALMYNIKYVKKNNTFFANGILVHNRYIN